MSRNTKCNTIPKYPNLHLYFDLKRKRLIHSRFFKVESTANTKFAEHFSRGSFVREICILILLAKYRGPFSEKPETPIPFNEKALRLSWLNSLGSDFSKDSHQTNFAEWFELVPFVTASRAAAGKRKKPEDEETKLPRANYLPFHLRLENVHIHISDTIDTTTSAPEADEGDLRTLALNLEKGRMKGQLPWCGIVNGMLADIDEDKKGQAKKKWGKSKGNVLTVFDTENKQAENQRKFGDRIVDKLKRETFGNIFFMIGSATCPIKSFAITAVANNVWDYQSVARFGIAHEYGEYSLAGSLENAAYFRDTRLSDNNTFSVSEGFYEEPCPSWLLFVPGNYELDTLPESHAPMGTWLAFYGSLLGDCYHEQCLLLERSNKMLDLFYRNIIRRMGPKYRALRRVPPPFELGTSQ